MSSFLRKNLFSTKGKNDYLFFFPFLEFGLLISRLAFTPYRYIDQYQTLLEDEGKFPSRQDREVYVKAVRTAAGDRPDWDNEEPDKAYVRYVQMTSPSFVDSYLRDTNAPAPSLLSTETRSSNRERDRQPGQEKHSNLGFGPTFNYEKWVRGGNSATQRKVTGDFSYVE